MSMTPAAAMRVFVAEAVDPVRNRLLELVREQPGMELVAQEQSIARFAARIHTTRPHLLLLGTRLADASSFEALEQLGTRPHGLAVVLLCDRLDGQYLFHANSLGVDYVLELNRDFEYLPVLLRQLVRSHERVQTARHHVG